MRIFSRDRSILVLLITAILSPLGGNLLGSVQAAEPTYWQDIRPILRKHCTVCHGAKHLKELDISGGLALDSYDAVQNGGKRPVLQPGKSSASLMVEMTLLKDENKRMPLGAEPLPPESIVLIRRWIDNGAKEGTRPAADTSITTVSPPRRTRKLDVILATNATPPAGILGSGATGKLELALKVGPLSPVAAVAFSPDGKLLAAGEYGQVTIWDLGAVHPVAVLTNVLGTVNDVRFSPDGKLLAVAGGQPSAKGDLRLYQVGDWKLLAVLRGHDDVVFGVAFRPDGKQLASASFDKTVRLWDVTEHRLLKTFTHHSDFVYAVAFSPDGKWLASASKDRTVRMVEAAGTKSLFTFSGMEQDVLALAVRPDGQAIVSSGFDPGLYWWDPKTGARVRVQGGHATAVHEICFSADSKLAVSAGGDRTIRLWDGMTGAPLRTLPVGSIAYAVAMSPNGKLVAGGSFDGFVRLWDVGTGRLLATLLALPSETDGDWLAATPEGYLAQNPALAARSEWRMAGKKVEPGLVSKVLQRPDVVAKAVRGEAVTAPVFAK
jgi:WD40 repeat protein